MLDTTPLVSVTICCYNSERYIAQTVQSVLDQTFEDFELIIVNDGSTDRTEEIVRSFDDPRIRYEYQENRGLAVTRNRTLELARGKYVAFLDHDDMWLPDKLEKQIKILNADPDIALVYSDSYLMDSDGKLLGRVFDSVRPYRGRVLPELVLNNFIPCLTVLVHRQALDKVGLFRPGLSISEDYELLLRIAELYQIDFVDAPLAKYRIHETRLSRNIELVCQEDIAVTEGCLKRCPDLKRTLGSKASRKLAGLHYTLGRIYLSKTRTEEARKQFTCSITNYPYQLKPYLFYGLTLLPNQWASTIVSWRRRSYSS